MVFYNWGWGDSAPPPPLRNSENIKAMTTRLGGYIVCLKISPLSSHHEVMTSHDVIIVQSFLNGGHLGPPSWISEFVQILKKPSKIVSKVIKTNKNTIKWSKDLKNATKKLFIIFFKEKLKF